MEPSDHYKQGLGSGPSGGCGPTHSNGSLPEDGLLRSVLENSDEVVKALDADGTLRYASPAFGRVFGYDPEEAVGKMNVFDHVHPDDLPQVLAAIKGALSAGGVATNRTEYRFRHADGSWCWMEGVGTYLPNDPLVGGVVVNARDVTERKEAEWALKESEERFRAQYENLPVPTYTWRRVAGDFVLVEHNDAARQFTGEHIEALLGSKATELLSERPVLLEMIGRCFTERVTLRRKMPWRMLGTGEERCFVATCVYVPPDLVMVHTEDVTEGARAEGRLRFQAQLLEAVGEAVIALDADRRVVYWNRAAEEMYGRTAEEVVGRRLMDRVVPEDLRTHAEEVMAGVRAGLSWKGEFVVRRKDGTSLTVEATNTPVLAEDGEQVGVVGGNNEFAFEMYVAAGEAGNGEGNVSFSPYSVSLAFSLAYAGARGETEAEMAETLNFLPQETQHPAFNVIESRMSGLGEKDRDDPSPPFRLNVANSAWGQEGFRFEQAYLKTLAEQYGAGMRPADFGQPERASEEINAWVEDETEDRIKDLLSPGFISPDTRLVLANAVYFKAAWASSFVEKGPRTACLPYPTAARSPFRSCARRRTYPTWKATVIRPSGCRTRATPRRC